MTSLYAKFKIQTIVLGLKYCLRNFYYFLCICRFFFLAYLKISETKFRKKKIFLNRTLNTVICLILSLIKCINHIGIVVNNPILTFLLVRIKNKLRWDYMICYNYFIIICFVALFAPLKSVKKYTPVENLEVLI